MRIFWLHHGLHIDPESQSEADKLVALVNSIRFVTKEQAMDEQDSARSRRLAIEPDAELGVGNPQIVPGGIAG